MRADARRNRERLLDAAVELILDVGGEPARDAIANRAGVGIGTLYRHFPDQQSLLHAGLMRPDTTAKDVAFAIIRACRPLAVGLPPTEERALAHRHVDICLDGLSVRTPTPSSDLPDH